MDDDGRVFGRIARFNSGFPATGAAQGCRQLPNGRYERGLYTCLIKPLRYAMGVRTVITRLSCHIEDWDRLQVYELARGLLLNPARDELRPIRLVLAVASTASRSTIRTTSG